MPLIRLEDLELLGVALHLNVVEKSQKLICNSCGATWPAPVTEEEMRREDAYWCPSGCNHPKAT